MCPIKVVQEFLTLLYEWLLSKYVNLFVLPNGNVPFNTRPSDLFTLMSQLISLIAIKTEIETEILYKNSVSTILLYIILINGYSDYLVPK